MDTTKSFYKIAEVAELLNVTQSTLRYWESQFKALSPARSSSGRRYYTPKDIENLEIIKFLVKEKGLRIEAAKEQMDNNSDNISRRVRLISTLKAARHELSGILEALEKRR
ncbi:MAG: MerR family transcriptional regulator [Muribaculaceae bacterium]|nr:MerR family transcriptional regulator [Muribaculaceae bacterium]